MKRFIATVLAAISAAVCAFSLVGCGSSRTADCGVFYLYEGERYDWYTHLVLDRGKWTNGYDSGGTYTLNGKVVMFVGVVDGEDVEFTGSFDTMYDTIKIDGSGAEYRREPEEGNDDRYSITLYSNGGAFQSGSTVMSLTSVSGGVGFHNTGYPDPTREGDVYIGWSQNADGSGWWDTREPVKSDMTLYAAWLSGAIAYTAGESSCTVAKLHYPLIKAEIPEEHDGKPVTAIADEAFYVPYVATGVTELVVPASVTGIGARALKGCSNLRKITYAGTTEQWSAVTKGEDWDVGIRTYTVVCSDGEIKKK